MLIRSCQRQPFFTASKEIHLKEYTGNLAAALHSASRSIKRKLGYAETPEVYCDEINDDGSLRKAREVHPSSLHAGPASQTLAEHGETLGGSSQAGSRLHGTLGHRWRIFSSCKRQTPRPFRSINFSRRRTSFQFGNLSGMWAFRTGRCVQSALVHRDACSHKDTSGFARKGSRWAPPSADRFIIPDQIEWMNLRVASDGREKHQSQVTPCASRACRH